MCMRNLLCRRVTTSLCSAGSYVVGDRGSMFRTRMHKQSLSVVSCDIRVQPMMITVQPMMITVQPMMITIEELQFHVSGES